MTPDDFAKLARLLPEPMLLVSGEGIVQSANDAAVRFLSRPTDALIGRGLAELTDDSEQEIESLLRAASRSAQFLPGHLSFRRPGQDGLHCRTEGALYRPRDHDVPALVLLRLSSKAAAANQFVLLNQRIDQLSLEVNRRRAAEAALQSRSEWLRVTLASIGDAVVATDTSGRVTLMNPVAERLTGWTLDEALGQPLDTIFSIVNEESRNKVESPVDKVLREGVVVALANHTLLIRKDGSESAIDDSGAPIRDDSGKLIGVVLVFHDISERRRMERELSRKTQALVEANERKDQFLSMLAHELRNPLAPLRTGAHLLHRLVATTPKIAAIGRMIERQVSHMTRLVDDLVDLARITRGSIDLRLEPVPLAGILDQALEMTRPLIETRNHRLTLHALAPDIVVDGDAVRLVQVFGNLLANAAEFTEPGGQIDLTLRQEGAEAVVNVRDNGTGIPAELLPRVFEFFVQADRSLDRSHGGLGIGLSFVHALVERHGGRVEAYSEGLGHGSEFVVRLPASQTAAKAPGVRGPAESAEPAHSKDEPSHPAVAPHRADSFPAGTAADQQERLRVLVVEDNVDAARSLCGLLEFWGHEVEVDGTGEDALETAARFKPRVLLLDIGLPGMSGYELARRLRRLEGFEDALLVAISGYGRPEDRRLTTEAGFDRHLTKPVDPEVLCAVLSELPADGHRHAP